MEHPTMGFGTRDSNDYLAGYSDADWAGCVDNRKSTSGGCFYLENNLMSWISKKQNLVSLSTIEAEYIVASSCCAQLLWMKKLLHDYEISQDTMCVFCDNKSAINLSKNPIQHSKSKHIEIWYHFIRDLVEEKILWLEFINTENQKVDIFTKPLDGPWFESLRRTIGVSIIPWLISLVWPTPNHWCIHVERVSHVIVSFTIFCLFTLFLLILLYRFVF